MLTEAQTKDLGSNKELRALKKSDRWNIKYQISMSYLI